MEYTATNTDGRQITFDWQGKAPPTQSDVNEIAASLEPVKANPAQVSFMDQLKQSFIDALPVAGGVAGGAAGITLGFLGGPPGSIAGGVAGGALGAGIGQSIKNIIQPPPTLGQAALSTGREMLYGGLTPPGAAAGSKTLSLTLGNKLTPAMQETAQIAKEAGIAPSISMLRPESKAAGVAESLIGKLPLASLFQRSQLNNIINKTGDVAEQTKNLLFEQSVATAKREQGALYQQALDNLPDRIPMPKTIEYMRGLLKQGNVQDVVANIKNDPNMAGLSQETLEDIIKTAVKKTEQAPLGKPAQTAIRAFLESADEAGTVSKEMLGTFKSSMGQTKMGKVAQKEIDRLFQSEMGAYSDDAARLWGEANQGYAYLSKLKPVENIFRSSFSTKQGYSQFNPGQYIGQYKKALEDNVIPESFKPAMDKLNTLAELSSTSMKRKAEFNTIAEIFTNIIGGGGLIGSGIPAGGRVPAAAITLSALALARSSTAKRGIIRKLATSGVMSKEGANALGSLVGTIGTMEMANE